jgi:hypothetical protein
MTPLSPGSLMTIDPARAALDRQQNLGVSLAPTDAARPIFVGASLLAIKEL